VKVENQNLILAAGIKFTITSEVVDLSCWMPLKEFVFDLEGVNKHYSNLRVNFKIIFKKDPLAQDKEELSLIRNNNYNTIIESTRGFRVSELVTLLQGVEQHHPNRKVWIEIDFFKQ